MGGWQLEIARMALYISFPVGVYHYFNQPQNFEEYVTKVKQIPRAMEDMKARKEVEELLENLRFEQQQKAIEEMEKEYQIKNKS